MYIETYITLGIKVNKVVGFIAFRNESINSTH